MQPAEPAPAFAAIKALVIRRTLHHYYENKEPLLRERVLRRMAVLGIDADAYLALLQDGRNADAEWSALEDEITVGETFFFRFAEQFAALERTILPALIRDRGDQRSLRIWSAGCSTGAEPYSVAILLHRLLGDRLADWSVSILGTDISAAALDAARAAEYGDWALRSLSDAERRRDFVAVPGDRGSRWRLQPAFQRMVRFERQNLLHLIEADPSFLPHYDLVLCRNVLIYFGADRVQALLQRFGKVLAPDGWLLLGHAEAGAFELAGLRPVDVDGATAWMRADVPASPQGEPMPARPGTATRRPARPPRAPTAPAAARAPVSARAEAEAVERVRVLADSGASEAVLRSCRDEIRRHPLCAALFFYAGLLERALARPSEAEADLHRAIYLCAEFAMAHYHLGLLLMDRGRAAAGRRAIAEAGRLAAGLPSDAELLCGDGMTADRLRRLARLDWPGDLAADGSGATGTGGSDAAGGR